MLDMLILPSLMKKIDITRNRGTKDYQCKCVDSFLVVDKLHIYDYNLFTLTTWSPY